MQEIALHKMHFKKKRSTSKKISSALCLLNCFCKIPGDDDGFMLNSSRHHITLDNVLEGQIFSLFLLEERRLKPEATAAHCSKITV